MAEQGWVGHGFRMCARLIANPDVWICGFESTPFGAAYFFLNSLPAEPMYLIPAGIGAPGSVFPFGHLVEPD